MVTPAYPHQLSTEEQRRLLAHVYAFILSDRFTGTYKGNEIKRTTRATETCQSKLTGMTHEVDAQELFTRELVK